MQRDQDMIASGAKSTDPVLRGTLAGVANQFRTFSRAGDERAERVERERRNAIPDLQRDQSGPGNADVEAIVGLAARDIGGVVFRSRLKPDVPVFGSSDLRRVGLIAANEPPEQPAGLGGNANRQQEMPHHRHPVPAEDEPLNVAELERAPRGRTGPGTTSRLFGLHAPEQAPKKSLASPGLRRLYFSDLAHLAPLQCPPETDCGLLSAISA